MKLATECMQVDGVVFLNECLFGCVTIGQRLCADVFRSLMLWSKISFASDVTGKIRGGIMNGCQS